MPESDTILQLGIEAAREGNRDEARNLFSLLTRQEPHNVQAWLWLAGVADGPDERRAALEQVVNLDPKNEMAIRGLQAMGVTPTNRTEAYVPPPETTSTPPIVEPDTVDYGVADESPRAPQSDEERYAAELDSAFDDYDTVERAAPPPRNESTSYDDDAAAAAAGGAVAGAGYERVRTQPRRSNSRLRDDDGNRRNNRGGGGRSRTLLYVLAGLIVLLLLGLLVSRLFNRDNGGGVATGPTPTLIATSEGGAVGGDTSLGTTGPISGTDGISGTEGTAGTDVTPDAGVPAEGVPTAEGVPAEATPDAGVPAEATPGTDTSAPPATGDFSQANPQPVAINTPLSTENWTYTFPSQNYGAVLGKQIGGNTATGQYVVVLMYVANNTGTDQAIPADFFVIKDAQGQVYTAQPAVSAAYTNPGVNADRSQQDAVPSNNVLTSVPLIFDVPSGSTNLVLFARSKTDQGFQVLNSVP